VDLKGPTSKWEEDRSWEKNGREGEGGKGKGGREGEPGEGKERREGEGMG